MFAGTCCGLLTMFSLHIAELLTAQRSADVNSVLTEIKDCKAKLDSFTAYVMAASVS